jgi:ankyrin repeat protein
MLIKKGADLHHPSIDPPVLMYAINSPRIETSELRLEIVKLLLSNDAKLDVVDEDGETPLYRACGYADGVPLISYLLDRGTDINGRSTNGETALHLAVRRQQRAREALD